MKKANYLFGLSACLSILLTVGGVSCTSKHSLIPEGKAIYIPQEFDSTDFNNPASRYSYHRMAYTDDVVCFWEAPFGDDPANAPDLNGHSMKFDVNNVMERLQSFYTYYRDTLHFIEKGSKADKYRMMVMINYSEEATAYGGGYDNVIGALWVTPSRLQDPKQNALAHELGHSFQAQVGADGMGNGKGGPIWEMTSQWMLWQVNPQWMTDENYHWKDFMKKTHLALMHFSNMYHSPYMLEYWADKHGRDIIGEIWKKGLESEDPVMTYKRLTGIDQETFNAEVFEAAQKFMTYDLKRVRVEAAPYANKHESQMVKVRDGFMIAPERCPGNYGYNGIRLNVPAAGTMCTIDLTGTEPEGIKGGWRYGIVLVHKDGTPLYGKMQKSEEGALTFKMIDGEYDYLWLVVTTAPEEHSIDPNTTWNYTVKLKGLELHPDAMTELVESHTK